ncbi:DNA primase family protein [Mycobacterium sp.]|uniref:DNA primase family protein n=1 Tax=Mycobacterium sp. TaxID=1785 RepID=UPI003F99DCD7
MTADDRREALDLLAGCENLNGEQPRADTKESETRTAQGQEGFSGPVIFPPPTAPYDVAKQLYDSCRDADGIKNLLAHRGGWQLWRTTHWSEVDNAEVRARVYRALENACYIKVKGGGTTLEPWEPTRFKVANVLDAMAAVGHLSTETDTPAWVEKHSVKASAAQVVSCRNGLLDMDTRTLHPHTPALFNVVSVPFDYHPHAAKPTVWLDFLKSVWGDDEDSITLLQEWFGYVLSGRLEQQKLVLLHGPSRSGKGTIAGVITQLLGGDNVGNPTMASMATNFGLWPLIGKPLAIISDARLGNAPADQIVERLLNITGEDRLTIDRKYQSHWTGKLPTRFMLLSNELPRFKDASGVIANRFLILKMTRSWLGNEDRELAGKLRPELPSILNWSLAGLDRLNVKGKFTVPQSSLDEVVLMQDMASPASAFVREMCTRGPAAMCTRDVLYTAYRQWCEDNGHHPASKSVFGRDLRAVVPELKSSQQTINRVRTHCHVGVKLSSAMSESS